MRRLLIALSVAALAATVTHPALAKGKGGSTSNGGSHSVANNRNTNRNVNINTNINTNIATATATATANVAVTAVSKNITNNNGGGGGGGGAGGGTDPGTLPGAVSGFSPFVGDQASSGGGSACCSDTSTPASSGWMPSSLDLGHFYPRATPDEDDKKWDVALDCRDEIGEHLVVKVSLADEGNMYVTATDGFGITWDRFEMYGGNDKQPVTFKKLGDNQYQWRATRNGMPGVSMTGVVARDPNKGWTYVERQNIGGGTRTFTVASCQDRAYASK